MDSIREKGHSAFLLHLMKMVKCQQLFGEGCGAAMECGTVDGSELFV